MAAFIDSSVMSQVYLRWLLETLTFIIDDLGFPFVINLDFLLERTNDNVSFFKYANLLN